MATETAVDVVMPQMGVSVSEGTVTKWLKQEGEQVEADEPLLEISTDKVDTEVPSPVSGTLTQILVQEGETVEVGTKIAQIGGSPGEAAAPGDTSAEPEAAEPVSASPPPLPRRRPLRLRRRRGSPSLPSPATGGPSSRRSWPGSPPSTASTRAPSRGPARAAG
jgi:pyruvate dehydrogenase E2 component (dihydrolipoyllysine-residue acetyltransferase)